MAGNFANHMPSQDTLATTKPTAPGELMNLVFLSFNDQINTC